MYFPFPNESADYYSPDGTSQDHVKRGVGFAVDIPYALGEPLYAIHSAKVLSTGWMGTCGLHIDYEFWYYGVPVRVRYCHLDTILVQPDQDVDTTDILGTVGNTGVSTGPHLHLVMWVDQERVKPENYLSTHLEDTMDIDRVITALNIIWGWAMKLDELTAEEASQQIRDAVVAVKEELGVP